METGRAAPGLVGLAFEFIDSCTPVHGSLFVLTNTGIPVQALSSFVVFAG